MDPDSALTWPKAHWRGPATSTEGSEGPDDANTISFIVRDQRFVISPEALLSLGSACLLNEAISEYKSEESCTFTWPEPLTLEAFALTMQWASTRQLPRALSPQRLTDLFRAADMLNVRELAALSLSLAPPPSHHEKDNTELLLVEAPYFLDVCESTFIARRESVDAALALPSTVPLLFKRPSRDRASSPLFTVPNVLRTTIEERLPPEARICLAQGLSLAGGFAARLAASLAGLCEEAPATDPSAEQSPDIDFFITNSDPSAALCIVRRTLLALARYCEEMQTGMCVVRSTYAVTVAMDDCAYDLQIVLCAFETVDDVLSNFDIDACRIAYTDTRLVASETFLRAVVSGVVIARPQNESGNHATRLHKYATELGYSIAIADLDLSALGKTPTLLFAWQQDWQAASDAAGSTSRLQRQPPVETPAASSAEEWEEPFAENAALEASEQQGDRDFQTMPYQHLGTNPALYPRGATEDEAGPTWQDEPSLPPYVPPAPQRGRVFRFQEFGPGVAYTAVNARKIVEVWRGQRRHPPGDGRRHPFFQQGTEPPPINHADFWRHHQAADMAYNIGGGASAMMHRSDFPDEAPAQWHNNWSVWDNNWSGWAPTDRISFGIIKNIIFQQLDMHPVRGAWNAKQKAFLATAVETEPLKFLDYIEDAALKVPPGCRDQLPRCLQVPSRDSAARAIFNRPTTGEARWGEE